jgi:hypothetical protein
MIKFDIGELVLSKIDKVSLYQITYKNIIPSNIDCEIPMIVIDKVESKYSETVFYFCLYKTETVLINDNIVVKLKDS